MRLLDLHDLGLAADAASYKKTLLQLTAELGFERMNATLRLGDAAGRKVANAIVDNTPDSIKGITLDPAAALRDPCFLRQMKSPLPFVYDQQFYIDGDAGDMWDVFSPFGYKTGISLSLHLPGNKHFLLSLDRHDPMSRDGEVVARQLADAHLMAVYANAAADRIFNLERRPAPRAPRLTPREVEALRWCMAGKSSWEIGQILALSENTVNFHVKNAVRKLDAVNRRDAVVKGMALGIL